MASCCACSHNGPDQGKDQAHANQEPEIDGDGDIHVVPPCIFVRLV